MELVHTGVVAGLQVGMPATYMKEGTEWVSGIGKRSAEGRIKLGSLGFEGDGQADLKHHGGPDKAVCVYCLEHYPYWEGALDMKLGAAAFGENITVSGLTEEKVRIGDIFRMGTALVQITQPRQPCYKLAFKYGKPNMPVLVQDTGYTGYYFRVLQEGAVARNDQLELVEASSHAITVAFANRIMHHEKNDLDAIRMILEVPELSASWRSTLMNRLEGEQGSTKERLGL